MARVTSTGNYLVNTTMPDLPGVGTIFIRFKPNGWSSGGVTPRTLFGYSVDSANSFLWYLASGGDGNIYLGWVNAGSATRIVIADTGIFTNGVWANHVYDWDDTADLQHLYVDNILKGTQAAAFTVPTGLTHLTIGTNSPKSDTVIDTHSGAAHVAEFARWDHVLDSTERATLESTGNPTCLPTGLVRHYKILGNDSPEPDEIGTEDLTLVGAPAQSTHPTVGSCAGLTIDPDSIAETATIPSPVVDMVLGIDPLAIAETTTIPSPMVTSDPFALAPTAIALDVTVPSPVVTIATAKGIKVTVSHRLADGSGGVGSVGFRECDIGDVVELRALFEAGGLIDPPLVRAKVRDASGVVATYVYGVDAEIERSVEGDYSLFRPITRSSWFWYRWEAEDDGVDARSGAEESRFLVRRSSLVSSASGSNGEGGSGDFDGGSP